MHHRRHGGEMEEDSESSSRHQQQHPAIAAREEEEDDDQAEGRSDHDEMVVRTRVPSASGAAAMAATSPTPLAIEEEDEEDEGQQQHRDGLLLTKKDGSSSSSSWLSPTIWNILAVETGERFAYFGFRAVLVLYFTSELQYTDRQAIAFFAYTTCLAYLSPILGALLADDRLGRYTTILYFGVVYWIGLVILTLGAYAASTTAASSLTLARALSFGGLFLVCLGTGGIKPCVSAFGADQVALRKDDDDDDHDDDHRAPGPPLEKKASDGDGRINDNTPVAAIQEKSGAGNNSSMTRTEQVRAFFSYFYLCINIGAVTSISIIPIVREYYGFAAAFLLPTVFMAGALALFLWKRAEYIHHDNTDSSLATTFRVCWWLFRRNVAHAWPWTSRILPAGWRPNPAPPNQQQTIYRRSSSSLEQGGGHRHLLVPSRDEDEDDDDEDKERQPSTNIDNDSKDNHSATELADGDDRDDTTTATALRSNQQLDDAAQALHVLPILAMLPIFWCLYDQQGSVWTLQATRMELNGLQPEQMNLVNPVEIMIFLPLFEKYVYPNLSEQHVRPLRRMAAGMLLTAVSFGVSGLVERAIQYRSANDLPMVNVFWQLPQITILAVAEIGVSVTGLEFAYSTSPDRLKAFLMAMYLLTTFVGDLLGGMLYSTVFQSLNLATVMYIFALLTLVNLAFFLRVAHWWERHTADDLLWRATAPLSHDDGDAETQQVELVTPQQRIV